MPNASFNSSWHRAANPHVMGNVKTHAMPICLNSDQSTDSLDRTRPVNTTEPTLQCVDETGILSNDAASTVRALASSMTNPLDGVIFVKSSPIVFITRLPLKIRNCFSRITSICFVSLWNTDFKWRYISRFKFFSNELSDYLIKKNERFGFLNCQLKNKLFWIWLIDVWTFFCYQLPRYRLSIYLWKKFQISFFMVR